MERIFCVKNNNLSEVNNWLQKGGRVKSIQLISNQLPRDASWSDRSDIYAYIVVEFD